MNPTERTLKHLRALGYLAGVVEKWNHHARIRQDLFGFVDVLAVGGGPCERCGGSGQAKQRGRLGECPTCEGAGGAELATLAVQATSGDHVAARLSKMAEGELAERVRRVIAAGWSVEVWGWRKNAAGRWVLRREAVGEGGDLR